MHKIVNINFRQNNFYFLLGALLLLLIALPLVRDISGITNRFFGHFAFSVTLIFAVLSLTDSKKLLATGLLFVISGIVFSSLFVYQENKVFMCIALISDFLFLLLVISIAIKQVLSSDKINLHNIAGAICIYLLLGVIWALAYHFVHLLIPDSFRGNISPSIQLQVQDFLYYSFVTLTTLGYGDIVPLTATARTLAFFEAIFGQFYIATLVAGLVTVHITNRLKNDK